MNLHVQNALLKDITVQCFYKGMKGWLRKMDVGNTEQSRENVVTVNVDTMYSREVCQVSVMFICLKNTESVARKFPCGKKLQRESHGHEQRTHNCKKHICKVSRETESFSVLKNTNVARNDETPVVKRLEKLIVSLC